MVDVRVPVASAEAGHLPLVCLKTGARADAAALVAAGGRTFRVPVSTAAVRAERRARRVEMATYAGGITGAAVLTMAALAVAGRPPAAFLAVLLGLALAAGAVATVRRRRAGVRAKVEGSTLVLRQVSPTFASATEALSGESRPAA
jgi:hypothetical protein